MSIRESIEKYVQSEPARFHMPGHKGIPKIYENDVTELDFSGNLFSDEDDCISELEERIPRVFFPNLPAGEVETSISCGGATLCIQAAVLAMVRRSGSGNPTLICSRDSHISLINAMALAGVNPLFLDSADDLSDALTGKNKYSGHVGDIIGVFVTSPDYFGNMKDISLISEWCKYKNIPLAVDNSHGSHLAFHESGQLHPINCGAAISIDSIHKTLPAPTGAALLHSRKPFGKTESIKPAMRVFASTSPSYLTLLGIESCIDFLEKRGREEMRKCLARIERFRPKPTGLYDPYRIVVSAVGKGKELYRFFAESGVMCEFAACDKVVLIPSVNNSDDDFARLESAYAEFTRVNKTEEPEPDPVYFPRTYAAVTLAEAVRSRTEKVSVESAVNKIAGNAVYAYPPGVPLVIPGEVITEEMIPLISEITDTISIICRS
ncbi:arginine decarboxylase [Clostridia bacterium]|nr:arginine decarboxylase [Clostridia bacterium]